MSDLEEHIKRLQDKLQQLLKKYNALQKDNERLKNEISSVKNKEEKYIEQINNITQKANILQAASGEMPKADQKEFEKHINQYIREIDKCITLLSE